MTPQRRMSVRRTRMTTRGSRIRARGVSTGVVLAILALAVPSLVAAANVTVSAIPGDGWIQSPEIRGTHCQYRRKPARRGRPWHEQRQTGDYRRYAVRRSPSPRARVTEWYHWCLLDDIRNRYVSQTGVGARFSPLFDVPPRRNSRVYVVVGRGIEYCPSDGRGLADLDPDRYHHGVADRLRTTPPSARSRHRVRLPHSRQSIRMPPSFTSRWVSGPVSPP